MKKRMTVFAAAAGMAFGALALTTADYVQDGLMEFWDGIDNAGNGTHNPNATVWKSLVQGGQDLTIDAGVWTDGICHPQRQAVERHHVRLHGRPTGRIQAIPGA